MRTLILAALALPALAACATEAGGAAAGACNAAPARFAVGEPYSEELAQRAMEASGSRTVRRLEPGMAYTLEFNDARLNLVTDATGAVTEVRCG